MPPKKTASESTIASESASNAPAMTEATKDKDSKKKDKKQDKQDKAKEEKKDDKDKVKDDKQDKPKEETTIAPSTAPSTSTPSKDANASDKDKEAKKADDNKDKAADKDKPKEDKAKAADKDKDKPKEEGEDKSKDKGEDKSKDKGDDEAKDGDEDEEDDEDEEEEEPLFCARKKVILERPIGVVKLREFDNIDVDGAPIIEGFPAEGLTSILAASYIVETLKLPLIGDITSKFFPPTCVVQNFQPAAACRIYGDKRVVVFVSELKIDDSAAKIAHNIVEAILDFAARHRCKLVISVEGIPEEADEEIDEDMEREDVVKAALEKKTKKKSKQLEEEDEDDGIGMDFERETPKKKKDKDQEKSKGKAKAKGKGKEKEKEKSSKDKDGKKKLTVKTGAEEKGDEEEDDEDLFFVCNSEQYGKQLKALNLSPLDEAIIGGITGGLLAASTTSEQDIICLLSSYSPILSDSSSAVPIVKVIDKLLGDVHIDLTGLQERVQELQDEVQRVMESLSPKKHQLSMYT